MKRLALILFTALLLTGCARIPPLETTAAPTEAPLEYAKRTLLYGDGAQDGWWVKIGNVTYSFAGIAPREEWAGMIEEAQSVLQSLEARFGKIQGERTLCTLFKPCETWLDKDTLYMGSRSFQTQQYAIGFAQMVFGNEVNYGLLYALGTEIAQERGYPVEDAISLDETLTLCETAPIYLDMNYACFLENYADTQTIQKVKTLARAFFASLSEEEKVDLLTDYSDSKYCRYLNKFLEAHGKALYDNSDLCNTLFYNGNLDIRLIWENEYGVFYVDEEYKEPIYVEGVSTDVINGSYQQLRQLVMDYRMQAAYAWECVGRFAENGARPKVHFPAPEKVRYRNGRGWTDRNDCIFLLDHVPFTHEYIHFLTMGSNVASAEDWLMELPAQYFTAKPGDPRIAYNWLEVKKLHESAVTDCPESPYYNPNYSIIFSAAEEHLDHPFDWTSPEDTAYFDDVFIAAYNLYGNVIEAKRGHTTKSSFARYLVSLVGEEAAIDGICNNTPDETFGKSWDELRADWEANMRGKYPWTEDIIEGGRK